MPRDLHTTNRNLLSMLLAASELFFFVGAAIFVGYPVAAFDWHLVKAYWFHNNILNYEEFEKWKIQ